MPPAAEEASIVARIDGRVGRILLNRPRALNALDGDMVARMRAVLGRWRDDPAVDAVVIEGAGGRAFCAGGDVRSIRAQVLAGQHDAVERFFAEEYALNREIAGYPKPYVALIDGICMGGGIGVSVHGQIRVATEAAVFAMPETAIAMFPDIGGSFFLPRLPGALGLYLGLTGARLQGAEAVRAGLATHLVARAQLPALSAALAQDGVGALAGFAEPLPSSQLMQQRPAIDRCFGAGGVRAILSKLEQDGSDWAKQSLALLAPLSPSALFWSHEIIARGRRRCLADCLAAELALTRAVTRHPDFAEGVRAMLVDKDRAPRWTPPRIDDVDEAMITAMFDPPLEAALHTT